MAKILFDHNCGVGKENSSLTVTQYYGRNKV